MTDSLKEQLIAAMAPRLQRPLAESVFEHDLWPVLERAMDAGGLLLARNTVKQLPVHEAIIRWLEATLYGLMFVQADPHTISKAKLLDVLSQLVIQASRALEDAKRINSSLDDGLTQVHNATTNPDDAAIKTNSNDTAR